MVAECGDETDVTNMRALFHGGHGRTVTLFDAILKAQLIKLKDVVTRLVRMIS